MSKETKIRQKKKYKNSFFRKLAQEMVCAVCTVLNRNGEIRNK